MINGLDDITGITDSNGNLVAEYEGYGSCTVNNLKFAFLLTLAIVLVIELLFQFYCHFVMWFKVADGGLVGDDIVEIYK